MAPKTPNLAASLKAPASPLVVEERPIPVPSEGEVVIRNHVIALNPIDWKRQAFNLMIRSYPTILGADVAGVIEAVHPSVTSFAPGDRVIGSGDAFSTALPDHAAFQTYTVVSAASTTQLSPSLSFLEGATIPTGVGTALIGLFDTLSVPLPPSNPSTNAGTTTTPILIWGAASNVGFMAVQLARLAGLTVYATASAKHHETLTKIGASFVVDYHEPTAVSELLAAASANGHAFAIALDAVSDANTLPLVLDVLTKSSSSSSELKTVAHTLPWPADIAVPDGVQAKNIRGDAVWGARRDLSEWLMGGRLTGWLAEGKFVPTKYKVVEGGVGGLQKALETLRAGVSGEKVVVEV